MIFAMMPMGVKAAVNTITVGGAGGTAGYENSDFTTLKKAFNTGDGTNTTKIILGADITIGETIYLVDKNDYVLDLAGYDFVHNPTITSGFAFDSASRSETVNLTITDSTPTKGTVTTSGMSDGIVRLLGFGNITINGGTYKKTTKANEGFAIMQGKGISLINDATIESTSTAIFNEGAGQIIISGNSKIKSTANNDGAIRISSTPTLKILEIKDTSEVINSSANGYELYFGGRNITSANVGNYYSVAPTAKLERVSPVPALVEKNTRNKTLDLSSYNGIDVVDGITPVDGVYTDNDQNWSFNVNTKTLVLNDVNFDVANGPAITSGPYDIKIIVNGEDNEIKNYGNNYGIYAISKLLFKGDGILKIQNNVGGTYNSSYSAIQAGDMLTVGEDEDSLALLICSGNEFGIRGLRGIKVNASYLNVVVPQNGKAVHGGGSLDLTNMIAYYNTGSAYDGVTHIQSGVICKDLTGGRGATDIEITYDFSYKGVQAATPSSTPISKTSQQIVLAPVSVDGEVVEYAISTSPTAPTTGWQLGTTFSGLKADTKYYFFARVSENDYHLAGVASAGVMIQTKAGTGGIGGVNTGDTSNSTLYMTLTLLSGCVAIFFVLKRKSIMVKK